jgi:hypothetical protein
MQLSKAGGGNSHMLVETPIIIVRMGKTSEPGNMRQFQPFVLHWLRNSSTLHVLKADFGEG